VANDQFMQTFENAHVENIITTSSDHYAVLLSLGKVEERDQREAINYNFKYDAAWCRAADYNEIVEKILG
jgi:hypothetical protein